MHLRAGGTGLTLIAANGVVHLDSWWNPDVAQHATRSARRRNDDVRRRDGSQPVTERVAGLAGYPVRAGIDYAERQSRWKAGLRVSLAVPLLLFGLFLLGGFALAIAAAILVSGASRRGSSTSRPP